MARGLSQLGLAAVLGVLAGVSIHCGDAGFPDLCTSDDDCMLYCGGGGCCAVDCPCGSAHSKREAERIRKRERDHCAQMKMECPAPRPDACDWNARYRAVCRTRACVAEPIEGGATAEFRAPDVPSVITAEDHRCRACIPRRDECIVHVEWPCEGGVNCRVAPVCDAACCNEDASIEDKLDAAPWGPRIAASGSSSPKGVLVIAVPSGEEHELGFVEMPGRRVVTTSIAVSEYGPEGPWIEPKVTWIDGTSDFLIENGGLLERVSPASSTRTLVLRNVGKVSSLDVSPAGDVALLALQTNGLGMSNLATVRLDQPDAAKTAVPWSPGDDAYPRWSIDGKRIVLANQQGMRVAIVDANTGRVEGPRTTQRFVRPTWHPSGEFLLLWLQDTSGSSCEMVVATPDRTRHARLGIDIRAGYCPPIAVSPEGNHVSTWMLKTGAWQLELFALGSSTPESIKLSADPAMLEWIPLQLDALGFPGASR